MGCNGGWNCLSYAINDIVSLKGDGIIYMTAKNNSLYIFYEECIVNCQNLKKRFEKLIKPVVDQSSKKTNNISNNTKKNSNIGELIISGSQISEGEYVETNSETMH